MPLERLAKGIPTFHPAILKTQQLAVGSELNLNYKLRQDSNSINTHRHDDILRHLLEKVSDMKDELIKGNGSLLINVHKSSSVAILNRLICDAATQAAAAHSESLQKISSHSRHTRARLKNDHFTSP